MAFRFPIRDVKIVLTNERSVIQGPTHDISYANLNQKEFMLDVEDTACFYARTGDYIEVMAYSSADLNTIELYLNGSVYGAILHQKKILPLHGSCFQYQGQGILICGESGVGKSSLTAAFCIKGADFLTDDITPVVFKEGVPHIWAMSDKIKLWSDSLSELHQSKEQLAQVMPDYEKFYFPMESQQGSIVPLNCIFLLNVHDQPDFCIQEIEDLDKFTALRNEVYRREYLRGMPESESEYLKQLISISKAIPIVKVYRNAQSSIEEVRLQLEKYITQSVSLRHKMLEQE